MTVASCFQGDLNNIYPFKRINEILPQNFSPAKVQHKQGFISGFATYLTFSCELSLSANDISLNKYYNPAENAHRI